MTTFTLQDLTPNDTPTREEEEAMDTLAKQQAVETKGAWEPAPIIQGATGAQYTPMDTSPNAKPNIHQLAQQLTESFALLIKAITELQAEDKQPMSGGEGLREAVETVLQNADWFNDNLNDTINSTIDDRIEEHDFSYEIESAVETHFSNSFCLEDHLDVTAEIESVIDDKLDDMVQEKLEEILREKLQSATISFN
jgi:hypothetical protein